MKNEIRVIEVEIIVVRDRMIEMQLIAMPKICDRSYYIWIDIDDVNGEIVFFVRQQKCTHLFADIPESNNADYDLHGVTFVFKRVWLSAFDSYCIPLFY